MPSPHPNLVKAGKIAARVLDEVTSRVSPGMRVLDVCTLAERLVLKYGGQPAFPCCVGVDHVVAHNTSPSDDHSRLPDAGLVKIDIGVHVDGYIVDTAKTVDIDGSFEAFVVAVEDALSETIALFTPGVKLGEVGSRIEGVIKTYGLRPIRNLSGHKIQRFRLHCDKSVPNVKVRSSDRIEVGECYAVEPFATNGAGMVVDSRLVYMFQNTGRDVELSGVVEKLRTHLRDRYGPFPFASRWIRTHLNIDIVEALRVLLRNQLIRALPVQVEKSGRPVSHAEHTVFVTEEGPVVLSA